MQNTIRIGIADAGDAQYDSNLIILGDSVQTVLVPRDDLVQMYATGEATLNVLGNDRFTGSGTLTITQINGVNVTAGQTITLPSGQQIRLNADGTITIIGDGDLGNSVFTYTVSGGGQTATGLVKVDAIPCFVAGTLILTPEGERAVESLRPGDLVLTRDDGNRYAGSAPVGSRHRASLPRSISAPAPSAAMAGCSSPPSTAS